MLKRARRIVISIIGIGAFLSPQAALADPVSKNAENIRKLDIMLMVTALRCRSGADNFQAEYAAFATAHNAMLNRAGRQLRSQLSHRHGSKGAKRALDRISVGMANQYGHGHPWLGCAELKSIARDLSKERDMVRLSAAADELLSSRPIGRYAAL